MELDRIWCELPSEMAERIMAYVPPNEIACTVRLINRAAAAQFCELKHRTVRLSQPTPHEAFAQRWGSAGAMRTLSLTKRRGLLQLTAASGVVANLGLAASWAGCTLTVGIFCAAAAAGQMASCKWLHQHGCPCNLEVFEVAARAGNREMLRFLEREVKLDEVLYTADVKAGNVKVLQLLVTAEAKAGNQASFEALLRSKAFTEGGKDNVAHGLAKLFTAAAMAGNRALFEWLARQKIFTEADKDKVARYLAHTATEFGHMGRMDWLLEWLEHNHPGALPCAGPLLFQSASTGGDLATLQRLYAAYRTDIDKARDERDAAVQAAASSLTPDWKAKVEWMAAQGWVSEDTLFLVDKVPDMHDRLLWLHQQRYRICERQVLTAIDKGDVVALNWLLELGLKVDMAELTVYKGDRADMAKLTGYRVYAMEGGRVFWRNITRADPVLMPIENRLPILEALLAHGHRPHPNLLIRAAESGDIAVVRWMVQTLGSTVLPPSLRVVDCRRATIEVLAYLRECGCSWAAGPLESAAREASEEVLEWMAANGCPMPVDGSPYLSAAGSGNLSALDCLERLGCQCRTKDIQYKSNDVGEGGEAVVRWFRARGHEVNRFVCSTLEYRP